MDADQTLNLSGGDHSDTKPPMQVKAARKPEVNLTPPSIDQRGAATVPSRQKCLANANHYQLQYKLD